MIFQDHQKELLQSANVSQTNGMFADPQLSIQVSVWVFSILYIFSFFFSFSLLRSLFTVKHLALIQHVNARD